MFGVRRTSIGVRGAQKDALVGGNWNNTTNAGAFYVNLNNTASNTNTNIGASLLSHPFKDTLINAPRIPYLLVKINSQKALLVACRTWCRG